MYVKQYGDMAFIIIPGSCKLLFQLFLEVAPTYAHFVFLDQKSLIVFVLCCIVTNLLVIAFNVIRQLCTI